MPSKKPETKEMTEKIKSALKTMAKKYAPPLEALPEPSIDDLDSAIPTPENREEDLDVNEADFVGSMGAQKVLNKVLERHGIKVILRMCANIYEERIKHTTCDTGKALFVKTREQLLKLAQEIM